MKPTGFRISLVILAYVFIGLVSSDDNAKPYEKKSKSVTSFVSAKWEATPIVLELAEYLAGESSDLFWSFFDGINSLKSSLDTLGKFISMYSKLYLYMSNLCKYAIGWAQEFSICAETSLYWYIHQYFFCYPMRSIIVVYHHVKTHNVDNKIKKLKSVY